MIIKEMYCTLTELDDKQLMSEFIIHSESCSWSPDEFESHSPFALF